MMRKLIICLALGFGSLWISTIPVKACGFGYPGFVFPYGWGCYCLGFWSMGAHLGLGPGYPGLRPPFSGFGFYPDRYPPPPRTPPIAVYTIIPGHRVRNAQLEAPSGPIVSNSQPGSDQTGAGPEFRRPASALNVEANEGTRPNRYVPKLCSQGECHKVDPSIALSPDLPPGIILWEPGD